MPKTILSVKNLSVDLGGERVIKDLSFDLGEKEILVVLGPNGAGKSVLLRTLLGIHSFSGKIDWEKDTHIGYLPTDFDVPSDLPLSVKEFFQFKITKFSEIQKVLKWVGLTNQKILEKKMGHLSTGQLRRVLIAWVMIDNPNVLLLDEPMFGLDVHSREVLYDTLVKFWQKQGQAIILVSHEIGEVVKKADKILAINKKMLFYGKPNNVIKPNNLAKIYGGKLYL